MSLPLRDCDTCGLPQLFDYISRNQYPFVETGHAPSPRQFVIINIQTTINQAMNKFITLILCLCCIFTSAWAEGDDHVSLNPSDANIVGHILDKKTGEHLSFINVYLHGTTIGTTTDATGHYYMKNLPEGKYTLVMKSIGYKTEEKTVNLKKGKTLEINFNAEEDAVSLDGVGIGKP